jgi:hypothetical protein
VTDPDLTPGHSMAEPRTAPDGHPGQGTLAFDAPVERDGTTIITASDVRTHAATRGTGDEPEGDGFDARMSGKRALGAFVLRGGKVRWRPAIDVTKVLTTAEIVVGGVLVARHLAARPSGAKALVTMGPGGWVSMKGGAMSVRPAKRAWIPKRIAAGAGSPGRRPWWARLLSAQALNSLLG